jgi:protease-4
MGSNKDDKGSGARGPRDRWERDLLERLTRDLLAERQRSRRWGTLFKGLLAAILFLIVLGQLHGLGERIALAGRHTALVDLEGEISGDSVASADNVIAGLRAAFESVGTAGVVVRANSPGGSPVEAQYISDEIRRLREQHPEIPLYAVIGEMCASGCYYALAGSDRIFASPASVVGSIGVLIDGFGFDEAMKKLGIERRLLTAGENKGMLDPFQPLDARARRHAQAMLDEIHQQFIKVVRQGRGEALADDPALFSGLIWTGEKARELGLVDDFGSAGSVARDVIGAEQIVDYTVREDFFQRFTRRLGAAIARTLVTETGRSGALTVR